MPVAGTVRREENGTLQGKCVAHPPTVFTTLPTIREGLPRLRAGCASSPRRISDDNGCGFSPSPLTNVCFLVVLDVLGKFKVPRYYSHLQSEKHHRIQRQLHNHGSLCAGTVKSCPPVLSVAVTDTWRSEGLFALQFQVTVVRNVSQENDHTIQSTSAGKKLHPQKQARSRGPTGLLFLIQRDLVPYPRGQSSASHSYLPSWLMAVQFLGRNKLEHKCKPTMAEF